MPAAIPIIAAFASGAVGAVVAGTASLAAYASVAGAVLTGVGALTGSKDLMKIGAVLSIGGGLASLATGASAAGGAAAAAEGASYGGASAAEAAAMTDALGGAADATSGLGAAEQAASLSSATPIQGAMTGAAPTAPVDPFQTAVNTPAAAAPAATPTPVGDFGGNKMLQEAAQSMGGNDMQKWVDKIAKFGGQVGDFVKKNKELMDVGGNMLKSMYGPEAEVADLKKREMQRAESIYEQNKKNVNSPIKFLYKAGG